MKGKFIFNGMVGRWFTVLAVVFFSVLMGIMGIVSVFAFSRKSGHTGQDMAQIHREQHEKR